MMKQHATPIYIAADNAESVQLSRYKRAGTSADRGYDEEFIKQLVLAHPEALPITEIDPTCSNPVPICDELPTPAGPIDAFLLTPTGMPVLIECKLWNNPEARREVVGQILDYAKELARWSYEDLQRAAAQRTDVSEFSLYKAVCQKHEGIDERDFIDAVTHNLRYGRCLLLVVGDGIREGVEAIGEYLTRSGALQFGFGLVEMPVYETPDGGKVIVPRTLAKTTIVGRHIVVLHEADKAEISEDVGDGDDSPAAVEQSEQKRENLDFWKDLVALLEFDDAAQLRPKPTRNPTLYVHLPPQHSSDTYSGNWITLYLARSSNRAGLYFTGRAGSIGGEITRALKSETEDVVRELGPSAQLREPKPGQIQFGEYRPLGSLSDEGQRTELLRWFAERANVYVNTFRPRIDRIGAELE